jgi:hypothetical protein
MPVLPLFFDEFLHGSYFLFGTLLASLFMFFGDRFLHVSLDGIFSILFEKWLPKASKRESKGTPFGNLLATFSDDRFVDAFWSPFGSLLALFWSQLAPFGFLLVPFGLNFGFQSALVWHLFVSLG